VALRRVSWTKYLGLARAFQFSAGIIADSVSSNLAGFSSKARPVWQLSQSWPSFFFLLQQIFFADLYRY